MKYSAKKQSLPFGVRCLWVAAIAAGGLLLGATSAFAQTCIEDVWQAHGNNQGLTCTAQDVTLSQVTNINVLSGGQCETVDGVNVCTCFTGGDVTFEADFRMDLTADTRYDVGFYIATDDDSNQDGALTGACSATASLAGNTLNGTFINLDAAPDVCGDITGPLGTTHNPLIVRQTVTVPCEEGDIENQKLDLNFCTTWRQPGSNEVCLGTGNGTTTNDVYPGSPSKCNCGTLAIDIFFETAEITVTKTALTTSVPETGGDATFSVTVHNDADVNSVTLDILEDDIYGDITLIHDANENCGSLVPVPGVCLAVTATDCTLATIQAQQDYSCQFTGTMPPGDFPGSIIDTVKACGTDSQDNTDLCDDDDAEVPYADVEQPPTLTKTATAIACQVDATYAVVVTNGSAQDTLTLNTLIDDVYGDITQVQGNVISTTCGQPSPGPGTLPALIAASGNYSCSFVGRINNCNTSVTDKVTGAADDDDGASYTPFDTATVTVTTTTP